jgi:exopolysaccharide production protein ExoZ
MGLLLSVFGKSISKKTVSYTTSQAIPDDVRDKTTHHAGNSPYRLLDAWRGVAALSVVLLHIRLHTIPAPLYAFSVVGLLGVPIFFVISGYCIANAAVRSFSSLRPVVHFLKARVRRIYPPYFFASLLAVLLSLLLTALVAHHIVKSSQIAELNLPHQGWRFYVGALTLTQLSLHATLIVRVFWSLCYEVAFYVVAAVLLFCAVRTKQTQRLLDALSLLTVGTLLWLNLAGSACPFPWNLWPQFGLGALVYQMLAQSQRKAPRIAFGLCGVLIGLYAMRYGWGGDVESLSEGLCTVFSLGFACLLLWLFRWDDCLIKSWPARLFSWLGLFSYSLYLIHLLALGIVTQGLNRLHIFDAHPLLLYLLKLVLCIAAGRLFFHFCERPFLDTRQRQVVRQETLKEEILKGGNTA